MPFLPIANFSGANHVLDAGAVWVHPGNGNVYACVCVQRSGVHQDLEVYRLRSGSNAWELVKRYAGTVDSEAQFTQGAAAIGQSGNMIVVTSLIIPGAQRITTSGFQACWIREMGIDAAWKVPDVTAIERRLAAIEQKIVGVETALGNLSYEGLSATDRDILDRLKTLLRL